MYNLLIFLLSCRSAYSRHNIWWAHMLLIFQCTKNEVFHWGFKKIWPNPQETADLVTFIEEILNGKLNFLCNVCLIKSMVKNLLKFNTTAVKQSSFIHLIIALMQFFWNTSVTHQKICSHYWENISYNKSNKSRKS